MPRQSIDDLFNEEGAAAPAAAPLGPPRPAAVGPATPPKSAAAPVAAPKPAPARRPAAPRPARTPRTTGLTESQTPKWQRLERKELRLRADQLDELARLRRTLNRQRGGVGERITENTLIRVAVDLLLSRSGGLQGLTEDELRNSVTT